MVKLINLEEKKLSEEANTNNVITDATFLPDLMAEVEYKKRSVLRIYMNDSDLERVKKNSADIIHNVDSNPTLWGASLLAHPNVPPCHAQLISTGDRNCDLEKGWLPSPKKVVKIVQVDPDLESANSYYSFCHAV